MTKPRGYFEYAYKQTRFAEPPRPRPNKSNSPLYHQTHVERHRDFPITDRRPTTHEIIAWVLAQVEQSKYRPESIDNLEAAAVNCISWAVKQAQKKTELKLGMVMFDHLLDRMIVLFIEFVPNWETLNVPTVEMLKSVNPAAIPKSPYLGFYLANMNADGFHISGTVGESVKIVLVINDCVI